MPSIPQQQNLLTKAYYDFRRDLTQHSFFKISNRFLSEDLVQETFLKAWKYMIRGGKIETMKAFLYHVLNGLIIDEYRKHKTVSLDLLVEKGFEAREDDSEKIINSLDAKRAVTLIPMLPKKYRRLVHMKYVRNMSLSEMSQATCQSKNTTAVQINRGLQKLKVIYNNKKTP
jgi:RNA polymerase sigma-70 factor (ECF subfamily)